MKGITMNNVTLIGMPGSGKSTIGEILAKLGAEKEETDWRKLKPLYIQPPPVTLKKL